MTSHSNNSRLHYNPNNPSALTPIQNVPLDMTDPRFAAQFIPSRHAPEPPTRGSPHSSNPSLARADSYQSQSMRREQHVSTMDDHQQQAIKKAHPHHGSNKPGFGFLKKLRAKQADDSDDTTTIKRTRSIHQQQQHAIPISYPTPRNLHNIPLAPPATQSSTSAPSIEVVGKHTYRRPELRSGIQESDDLLSSIPDELRSRPSTSLQQSPSNNHVHNPIQQQQQSSTTTTTNFNSNNITTTTTATTMANSSYFTHNTRRMVSSPSSPTLNGHNSDSASVHSTNRERQKSTDTSDNDDDTPLQQGTQRFSSWSNASTGKSSGSFSLYSTFGPEASDSTLDLDQQPLPELPIGHRSPSPPSSANKKEETTTTSHETNQADDDEDDSDSDDDDLFVDATGMSQEDMEREKRTSSSSSKKRLSKRLSGGHFGSAGGLMLSTAANRNSTQELAELMMNWRRESIDISLPAAATLNNRPPSISRNNPPSLTLSSGNLPPIPVAALSPPPRRKRSLHQLQHHPPSSIPPPPPPPQMPLPPAFTSSALPDPPPPNQPSPALPPPPPPQSSASAPTMTTRSMDKETAHEGEARFAAQHIWQDDESFIVKERAAEWLGQGKPLNGKALVYYMDYFDFSDMRMDTAFRKLCSKLYFKAEAQQIDRILQVFAQRYWKCNPESIFGNPDIVYAVAYSLLLLNTDLHVAQGNHTRMNRVAFVRNTMSTIQDQLHNMPIERKHGSALYSKTWEHDLEIYLKELYTSVKHHQILQPLSSQSNTGGTSNDQKRSSSILGGGSRRVVDFKRSVNSMVRKSGRESTLFSDDIVINPMTSPLSSPKRGSFASSTSATSSMMHHTVATNITTPSLSPTSSQQTFASSDHHHHPAQPPYYKEGVVIRKHLLETSGQKSKHREWKECFVVVGHGELKMYASQGSNGSGINSSSNNNNNGNNSGSNTNHHGDERRSLLRASSINNFAALAESLSHRSSIMAGTSTMQLLGTIKLNHSLANVLPPPGYNRQRPHVFAVQQPHGGVYLFQAPSHEQVNEWVATCNYWAARQSKEPLAGGVSNMEYGWGSCLDDVILDLDASVDVNTGQSFDDPDAINIYEWKPPMPPSVSSTLDELDQLDTLRKHLGTLSNDINEHRDLKRKMLIKFSTKTQNHTKVMSNWESKSTYLLHEIIKYQNYCDALEKCIKQHQQEQMVEEVVAPHEYRQSIAMTPSLPMHLEYEESEMDLFSEIGKELAQLSTTTSDNKG